MFHDKAKIHVLHKQCVARHSLFFFFPSPQGKFAVPNDKIVGGTKKSKHFFVSTMETSNCTNAPLSLFSSGRRVTSLAYF